MIILLFPLKGRMRLEQDFAARPVEDQLFIVFEYLEIIPVERPDEAIVDPPIRIHADIRHRAAQIRQPGKMEEDQIGLLPADGQAVTLAEACRRLGFETVASMPFAMGEALKEYSVRELLEFALGGADHVIVGSKSTEHIRELLAYV